ncbi:ABC transporter substrate-binding protein [Phascolarctobacterium succinatutens]|uniref:ABC transporter substrate-binding protein n=1 Tax=Phascolarctobacterium succinatutens TaxID=626940 RepID=UPI0026EBF404|nr:ABC transporter substrate-binding protein [Phascolarctobacterium succinatutens]
MKRKYILMFFLCCLFISGCKSIETDRHPASDKAVAFSIENYDSSMKPHIYKFTQHPQRIVALWQNSIETLIALGAGDKIIAVAGVYNEKHLNPEYLEAYKRIPVRQTQIFSQENVLLMHPDFIAGWLFDFTGKGRSIGTSSFWEERNVNVYMNLMNGAEFKAQHTVDDELKYIMDLGKIVGNEAQAAIIISDINNKILRYKQQLAVKKRLKVLVVSNFGKTITIYTPRTLAGDILTRLGADVIGKKQEAVGENEYISYEEILTSQPDVIFLQCSPENENMLLKSVYSNPALQNVKCIKKRQVYCIPFYTIRSPGIRIDDAIDIFAKGLIKGSEYDK